MTDRIWGYGLEALDGDTFKLDVSTQDPNNSYTYGDIERIRLRGINAPETGQHGAAAAKARLTARVVGHSVSVVVYSRDVYGRLIGDLAA